MFILLNKFNLYFIGKKPNTTKLNIEKANIQLDKNGYITVDKFQNISQSKIYAVGDIIGNIATVLFSHPPIGTVWLTEKQAIK